MPVYTEQDPFDTPGLVRFGQILVGPYAGGSGSFGWGNGTHPQRYVVETLLFQCQAASGITVALNIQVGPSSAIVWSDVKTIMPSSFGASFQFTGPLTIPPAMAFGIQWSTSGGSPVVACYVSGYIVRNMPGFPILS